MIAKTGPAPVRHPDRFFIDGNWVTPSSQAMFDVLDSNTEDLFFRVSEAQAEDMEHAIAAAKAAFDGGPWPRLTHNERAQYLRAFSTELRGRADVLADIWPRESGVLHAVAVNRTPADISALDLYADMAADYPWEERVSPPPMAGSVY